MIELPDGNMIPGVQVAPCATGMGQAGPEKSDTGRDPTGDGPAPRLLVTTGLVEAQ